MNPAVKFSQDIVPLGDLKVNPGKVVKHADETGRPVLLTSHGRGVAVVQGLSDIDLTDHSIRPDPVRKRIRLICRFQIP